MTLTTSQDTKTANTLPRCTFISDHGQQSNHYLPHLSDYMAEQQSQQSAQCAQISLDDSESIGSSFDSSENELPHEKCALVWQDITFDVRQKKWLPSAFADPLISLSTDVKCQNDKKTKNPFSWRKPQSKCRRILNHLSGHVSSGQMLALIGPSGVGKSTLLQILAGRTAPEKLASGHVHLCAKSVSALRINPGAQRIAFIPQKDVHLASLTVRETLLYASLLKNQRRAQEALIRPDDHSSTCCSVCDKEKSDQPSDSSTGTRGGECSCSSASPVTSNAAASTEQLLCECRDCSDNRKLSSESDFHRYLVQQILHSLSLSTCGDTQVCHCSGGQQKRLSLAVELLGQPRVIILDEPTTGLDFSSALNCVRILRSLSRTSSSPPAIIASVHQPSSCVLKQFDRVYVLAQGGVCLLDAHTHELVQRLSFAGLHCPLYFNPADLLLQCAAGQLGALSRMVEMQIVISKTQSSRLANLYLQRVPMHIKPPRPPSGLLAFIQQWRLLIARSGRASARRPLLSALRLAYFSFFALFIYATYNYPIGQFDGCARNVMNPPSTTIPITTLPDQPAPLNYAQSMARLADNASLLFFVSMFLVISAILPAALTFPSEFVQFARERANGWYSTRVYFVAKCCADLPAYVLFPILFAAIFYPLTGQPPEAWRFGAFCALVVLNSLISRSVGLLIGTLFLRDTMAAVFVSTCAVFPFMLASGFLVRPSVSTWLLRPFWHVSFVRYTFGCLLLVIYGFGRCTLPTHELENTVSGPLSTNGLAGWTASMPSGALQSLLSSYLQPREITCVSQLTSRPDGIALVDGLLSECKITADSLAGQPILGDLAKHDHSFILSYFEIRNEDFNGYLLALMITLIVLTSINYWLLLFRVRRCTRL